LGLDTNNFFLAKSRKEGNGFTNNFLDDKYDTNNENVDINVNVVKVSDD
jgi:hypothetical protein